MWGVTNVLMIAGFVDLFSRCGELACMSEGSGQSPCNRLTKVRDIFIF